MSSSEWAYVVERVVTPVGASSGRASSISRVVAKEAANGRVFASVACWRTKKGRRAGETTPAVFVSSLEVEERFRRRGVARGRLLAGTVEPTADTRLSRRLRRRCQLQPQSVQLNLQRVGAVALRSRL